MRKSLSITAIKVIASIAMMLQLLTLSVNAQAQVGGANGMIFTGTPDEVVLVKSIAIEGNTVFKTNEMSLMVSTLTGKMQTLDSMSDAADKIAQKYWRAGYTKARVWVPEQRSRNGLVVIKVEEGIEKKSFLSRFGPLTNPKEPGRSIYLVH